MNKKGVKEFYEFGGFRVDVLEGLLLQDGQEISLTPTLFDILLVLIENHGHIVEKELLMQKVWPERFVEEGNLTRNVSTLRKVLGDDSSNPHYIETIPRRGYRFVAEVRVTTKEDTDLLLAHTRSTVVVEVENERDSVGDESERVETSGAPLFATVEDPGNQPVTPTVAASAPSLPSSSSRRWCLVLGGLSLALLLLIAVIIRRGVNPYPAREQAPLPVIQSLAVLPVENLSGNPDQEYFADGMTDALISNLGRIRALRVISRTSMMQYKGGPKSLPKIAQELGVEAVLESAVLQVGNRARINVQLIEAKTDRHLWTHSYERDLSDVLALQSQVARAIATAIEIQLTPQEQSGLAKTQRVNPKVFEAYLKGRYHWNKRSAEGMKKGIEYFEKAVEKDSDCAPAYAGLADSYNMLPAYGLAPARDSFLRAKEAARKALKIDDTLADAHTALAYSLMYSDWNWPEAEREFKLAIELNPNYTFAHHWYAVYFQALRRHDEAIAEMKRALELDPLSLIINSGMSWVFCRAGRYDEAIDAASDTVELDPSFAMGHVRLGFAYEQKQMFEKAIHELQVAVTLSGRNSMRLSELGRIYAASGQKRQAQQLLNELRQISRRRYVPAQDIAWIYTGLAERDAAFAWWEKAYEERGSRLAHLRDDPGFDNLRSDPRFADLLRRLGHKL